MKSDEFFEDEVLEGFYVPSMIKRCWAVELEVLAEFDRVCQKYGISYFANWGTLLAAIRHGGMIPWDDDVDVVMTRNEFERFYAVAKEELPKEYHFVRFETSENCWQFIINLMCNSRMCFDPEYLERHHGFPYMAGLDIFILDNYCPDENQAEEWRNTIKKILVTADLIWEGKLSGKELQREISEIERLTAKKLKQNGNRYENRLELYILARDECAKYNGETTDYISQMLPWGIFDNIFHPRQDYAYAVRIPFGNTEIPVPLFYHKLLTEKYHNYYMVCKNGFTAHDYPFFEGQRKMLGEDVDFVPQFRFSKDMLLERGEERIPLIKRYSRKYSRYFKNICSRFETLKNSAGQSGLSGISMEELIDCQEQAILYGQYLEEAKGEDFAVIRVLEQYCEAVYRLSEAVSKTDPPAEINSAVKEALEVVCRVTDELLQSIQTHILNRSSVLFVPYKAKYWRIFHPIWKAAKEDKECDVYVVPSPYQYKKYDGTPICSRCELTGYPKEVTVTSYENFDFEKAGMDIIYFQNPYDAYNMAVNVLPGFYSSNLKRNCRKLVYIPYFREDDFTREDEKQYCNMKYYCTMPGVVNADQVIVASRALKQVYVQKLCEFAGEDTREVWESKILDMGDGLYERRSRKEAAKQLCRQGISVDDGKWIVYYTAISSLCEKKGQALEKVKDVLDSFCRYGDKISFIWVIDPAIKRYLKDYDPALASDFYHIADRYKAYGKVIQDLSCADLLADFCDAYYGDPSFLMQKFANAQKPVMVCSYDV